jgi:hypothetical protein
LYKVFLNTTMVVFFYSQTEEVKQKKIEYSLLVERLQDPCEELAKEALTAISAELRTGTSSMISGETCSFLICLVKVFFSLLTFFSISTSSFEIFKTAFGDT